MKPDPGRKTFTIKKKTVLWILYLVVLTPICLELALRVISAKPYIQTDYHIEVSPPNAFSGNDSLGIVLNPGTFNIVLNDKVRFQTTHTPDGLRKVVRPDSIAVRSEIAVMGCSFTYGYGVNDHETAVSIIQKKYPQYKFNNYGVMGYGTLQSYFQLEAMIANGRKPDAVILNFASDHFERNALTKKFRRAMKIGFDRSLETAREMMRSSRFPYLQDADGPIIFDRWADLYSDWKWRDKLASVNWVQTMNDDISDGKRDLVGISSAIIEQMNNICRDNNIHFLVVLLDEDERILELEKRLKEQNMEVIRVGFDFGSPEFTNVPFDIHPNQKGQRFIASMIENKVKNLIRND